MALKTTIRLGGVVGSTTWDATLQVPLYAGDGAPLLNAGMRCDNGSSCQFDFLIEDRPGEISRVDLTKGVGSHNVITISENAPGYEVWLGRGRVSGVEGGRGGHIWPDTKTLHIVADDGNADLKGLALTADWVRGEESGRARVLAMLAAFCNASPRLTTVISTHLVASGGEVTMPAKTYQASTELPEILNDCASSEGKVYSVVIHNLSSASHLCFLYVDEDDHSTYPCTLSISDKPNEVDGTTVFAPIWDQGPAFVTDEGDVVSGIVSRYGLEATSFAYANDVGAVTAGDYWVVPYNDSVSVTPEQALARAGYIRDSRILGHVSHQVTIQIRADRVHLLAIGMSIGIKSAASMGGQYLNTVQTRRIAQLKWEPIAPQLVDGTKGWYYAHMQLDRPADVVPAGKGLPLVPQPPATGGSGALTCDNFDSIGTLTAKWVNSGVETDVTDWYDTPSDGPGERSSTQAHSGTWSVRGNTNHRWYVFNTQTFVAGTSYVFAFWARHDSNTSPRTVRVGHSLVADDVHWGAGDYEDLGSKTYLQETYDSGVWVQHCIVWTPAATYTDSVRIDFHFGASYLDDGEVYEGGAGILGPVDGGATGTSGTYAPLDHQHPPQECCDDDGGGGISGGGTWPAIGEPPSFSGTADNDFTSDLGGYTAVAGSAGTVNLFQATTTTAIYDLATRSGTLLIQVGHAAVVQLRCDYTLPDGRSMVMAVSGAAAGSGSDNMHMMLGLNTDDSVLQTGTYTIAMMEQDLVDFNAQGINSADPTGNEISSDIQLPGRVLLRMTRVGLVYTSWASWDGATWIRMQTFTAGAALTNVWIRVLGTSSAQVYMPVVAINFIVEGSNDYDPW